VDERDRLQEILDTYTDDAGPIPSDKFGRNAWFRGLVKQAFRAARSSRYSVATRNYDRLGRRIS
jgi:hypothetical protein